MILNTLTTVRRQTRGLLMEIVILQQKLRKTRLEKDNCEDRLRNMTQERNLLQASLEEMIKKETERRLRRERKKKRYTIISKDSCPQEEEKEDEAKAVASDRFQQTAHDLSDPPTPLGPPATQASAPVPLDAPVDTVNGRVASPLIVGLQPHVNRPIPSTLVFSTPVKYPKGWHGTETHIHLPLFDLVFVKTPVERSDSCFKSEQLKELLLEYRPRSVLVACQRAYFPPAVLKEVPSVEQVSHLPLHGGIERFGFEEVLEQVKDIRYFVADAPLPLMIIASKMTGEWGTALMKIGSRCHPTFQHEFRSATGNYPTPIRTQEITDALSFIGEF